MAKLLEITGKAISGEWGQDDDTGTGIPVLRTTNFTNEGFVNYKNVVTRSISKKNIAEKYLRHGDVIIEKSGGSDKQPVGRVIFFEGEENKYLFNNFTGLLRVQNPEEWLPKYVFYALYTYYRNGGTRAFENRTTGLHNLQVDNYVKSVDIPKLSYRKQQHICETLDHVRDAVAYRERQLTKLDELIKARFVELTENVNTVPTRMGDIATYINGYAFKPTDWKESGLPIIRIQNLNDATARYNYFDGKIDSKYLVTTGDILVSWATHLEAYIWNGNRAWLNQHIFKVLFNKIPINKIYFVYATEDALRQAFKNAHGFKPTMEHIKRSDFENAIVKLPPMEIQNQFAAFVAEVDKSKVEVQKALDQTQLLFDSLMQQYFG